MGEVVRAPYAAGRGRNASGRITSAADSVKIAPVLNAQGKTLRSEELLRQSNLPSYAGKKNRWQLQATSELRGRLAKTPCEVTKEQMEAAKEKLAELLHLNGNGKKSEFAAMPLLEKAPPISAKQVVELAYYYYLKVLSKTDPSNWNLRIEMKSCQPNFKECIRAIEALPGLEKERARKFFAEARKEALAAASRLLELRRRLDWEIMQLGESQKKELALLEEHRLRMMTAIGGKYTHKRLFLGEWMGKKVSPLSEFLKRRSWRHHVRR